MTNKITLIIGKGKKEEPTGKSFLANQMSLNYDHVVFIPGKWTDTNYPPFYLADVTGETELIILDEINKGDLPSIISTFITQYLNIKRRGREDLNIRTPNIIITSPISVIDLYQFGATILSRCKVIETSIESNNGSKTFIAKRLELLKSRSFFNVTQAADENS